MKPHDHFTSLKRRALCATTLAFLVGAVAATAQSGGAGAGSSNYGAAPAGSQNTTNTSGTTGTRTNESTRNQSGTSASGSYGSSTRSGSTDSSYGSNRSASGSMAGSATDADKLSWGDKRFVTKAADHGQSEVQLAQLAAQQASNPEVRRFAQRLVNDHSKVNSELMSIASTKNVKLDKEDKQDRTYRRLSERSGSDFDQEFIEQMIDMHEADIKLFEKTAEDAKDQELRSFASRHVGHLREHLQQAQSLRQTIMPTGRESDSNMQSTTGANQSTTGSTATGAGSTNTSSSMSGATPSEQPTSGTDDSARPNR